MPPPTYIISHVVSDATNASVHDVTDAIDARPSVPKRTRPHDMDYYDKNSAFADACVASCAVGRPGVSVTSVALGPPSDHPLAVPLRLLSRLNMEALIPLTRDAGYAVQN